MSSERFPAMAHVGQFDGQDQQLNRVVGDLCQLLVNRASKGGTGFRGICTMRRHTSFCPKKKRKLYMGQLVHSSHQVATSRRMHLCLQAWTVKR